MDSFFFPQYFVDPKATELRFSSRITYSDADDSMNFALFSSISSPHCTEEGTFRLASLLFKLILEKESIWDFFKNQNPKVDFWEKRIDSETFLTSKLKVFPF
jgi:hypothetical protein